MTATSKSTGHDVRYDEKLKSWVYKDGKGNISGNRPCRYCGKPSAAVRVKIPADLSSTGKVKWKYALIDNCIAPIIEALQKGGIDMRGSCCGHGEYFGEIHLQDGRTLLIVPSSKRDFTNKIVKEISCIYNKFFGDRR